MDSRCIWIRAALKDQDFTALRNDFPSADLLREDEGNSQLPRIEAVLTEENIPDEMVQQMTRLRWIHVTRGGAYSYFTPTIVRRPIDVTTSKGIHGPAFSEFAIASIFTLAKKLPECWEAQKKKKWQRIRPELVAGKTLGIVGLGTVGSELARKAKALGMRVVAIKRTASAKPDYVDVLGAPDYLSTLLSESDFIVLCLASVPSTEKLIGEKDLRATKKSAYLINLTGGKAVEEALLIRALKEGWFAGAVLDALARQPLPEDSELWSLPNVMISPRIAGSTVQTQGKFLSVYVENLRRFLAGEELMNVVDKTLGY